MTATENTGEARWAWVQVRSGAKLVAQYTVVQNGLWKVSAGAATWAVAQGGGTATRAVDVVRGRYDIDGPWSYGPPSEDYQLEWQAKVVSSDSWLHVTKGGPDGGQLLLVADQNPGGAQRTAQVLLEVGDTSLSSLGATYYNSTVITVTQAGAAR
jgi:hypothetical protein